MSVERHQTNESAGRSRYRRVLLVIAFCIGAYAAWSAAYPYVFPTIDVRFRLAVEVMAGGKIYSNESIVDATLKEAPYLRIAGAALRGFLNGPCASIDLGPAGILFIVDKNPRVARSKQDIGNANFLYSEATDLILLPFNVYSVRPRKEYYALQVLEHKPVSGALEGKINVPLDRLPMIVRFRDIDDPDSLEELDPNDLSAAYGPGSRVIRATIEMTRDQPGPIPSYWPAWISKANPQMGLNVAIPYKQADGVIGTERDYLYISQIIGDGQ